MRVESAENQVRIDISDSGVGIAREALNRIFDMVTRVGRDTKNAHQGLGIGLNLARRFVELHGGQLTALSEGLGKGSHFLTSLPFPEPAQEPMPNENLPTGGASFAPIRALIVDDNVDAAVTLSLLLQLGGHTTALAHDGPEALRRVPEFKPDIVLLDLGLPRMDGYEVARAIRRMPNLDQPVLAAVTGWGAPEDRLRTKQAGFDEHLTKPVDISMIELILTTLPRRGSPGGLGGPPATNGHTLDTDTPH
jgi:CheY-like chemotaxis protein